MSGFDPYQVWLDIAPHERPVNHYRLLGLRSLEDDPQTIARAADSRAEYVRRFEQTEHAAACRQLLGEITAAKTLLLDPLRKRAYDGGISTQTRPTAPGSTTHGEQPIAHAPAPGGQGAGERQIANAPAVPGKPAAAGFVPQRPTSPAAPRAEQILPSAPPPGATTAPQGQPAQPNNANQQGSASPLIQGAPPPPGSQPTGGQTSGGAAAGIPTPAPAVTTPQSPLTTPAATANPPTSTPPSQQHIPTASTVAPMATPVTAQTPAPSPAPPVIPPSQPSPYGQAAHSSPPTQQPEATPAWAPENRTGQVTTGGPGLPRPARNATSRNIRRKQKSQLAYVIAAFAAAVVVFFFAIVIILALMSG